MLLGDQSISLNEHEVGVAGRFPGAHDVLDRLSQRLQRGPEAVGRRFRGPAAESATPRSPA